MPIIPVDQPQHVPVIGGFDYVTVDAARRRVYAAHGGSRALLIVDADSGKIIGQVRVGPMSGVAYDPVSGHVFTGNGTWRSVSEVDPVALKELRSVDLPGDIDAIAYDAQSRRIFADEGDGTHIYVIDAKTFKRIGSIVLPGHKPEYLAINANARELYQNIDDLSEVAVIDLRTLKVKRVIKTPALQHNHPLQFDPVFNQILVGGINGKIDIYNTSGTLLHELNVPEHIDQCDLDAQRHLLACAGSGKITLVKTDATGAPQIVGQIDVAPGMHTLAIDPQTGAIWAVWATKDGDFIQHFTLQ
ncbi:MAG: YncE family protein [Candidatus Eremiobacteraeota bacterium]|nr:YncE family protein [Candidatus Eremiobacteraeota bacterium]